MARSLLDPNQPGRTETQLLEEIAYYKARLADMRKAPETSRHRDGLQRVAERLKNSETMLARLRDRRTQRI